MFLHWIVRHVQREMIAGGPGLLAGIHLVVIVALSALLLPMAVINLPRRQEPMPNQPLNAFANLLRLLLARKESKNVATCT